MNDLITPQLDKIVINQSNVHLFKEIAHFNLERTINDILSKDSISFDEINTYLALSVTIHKDQLELAGLRLDHNKLIQEHTNILKDLVAKDGDQ